MSNIAIEDAYPLLPAQRGFLVDSLAGESDQYRQQICVEVNISAVKLKQHIQQVVSKNKILRTVFDWSDGQPMQVVISGLRPVVEEYETTDDSTRSSLLQTERMALGALSDAPPIRFAIISQKSQLFLAVTYHHILLDGPSISLLLEQIMTGVYLPDISFDTYQGWLEDNVGANEYAIWEELLANINRSSGIAYGQVQDNTRHYEATLDKAFYGELINKAKTLHVTPAVYLQTLWSEWALAYFHKEKLLYGLVTSTRLPGLTDTALGPYIATVPWLVSSSKTETLNATVAETNDIGLRIAKAKHIPLGDIAKHTSPQALGFEFILTITTRPVENTAAYTVTDTYENTGYKLSVDIEITDSVQIKFTTILNGISDALVSFADYCERQIKSSAKLDITGRAPISAEQKISVDGSDTQSLNNTHNIRMALSVLFDIVEADIDMSVSFLEMGGDSIIALRFKSLLRDKGLDVSIGDILQADSIRELTHRVREVDNVDQKAEHGSSAPLRTTHDLLGDAANQVTPIPSAALAIVNAYRLGYGQDYHEQTAFCLSGSFDTDLLEHSLKLLANELPTLRLHYPKEMPMTQVLTNTPRVTLEVKEYAEQSFDMFVKTVNIEDWNEPFDIASGPMLRVVVSRARRDEWYFFMSFSALVTDGWSFATMLERLFNIYASLNNGAYIANHPDPYMNYADSTSLTIPTYTTVLIEEAPDGYTSNISGADFVIEESLAVKIFAKSQEEHQTVSHFLLNVVHEVLKDKGFADIQIYENGRDTPDYFESVGPYCRLSSYEVCAQGLKHAYFVFENYPRDSEDRLKSGQQQYFHEHGNWRRNLLPPMVATGFLFDAMGKTITAQILSRDGPRSAKHYGKLIHQAIEEKFL